MIALPRLVGAARSAFPVVRLPGIAQWLLVLVCLGSIHPALADPLAEALDQPSLTFSTSGDAPWFVETAMTADGVDAVQGGRIDYGQSSSLSTTVSGRVTVSFRWRISTGGCCDYLVFYIDGIEQQDRIQGNGGWSDRTYKIDTPGEHVLTWTYLKNAAYNGRYDAVWVDKLSIKPEVATAPPTIKVQPASATVFAGDNALLRVGAAGGDLFYQWYEGTSGDTSQPVPDANRPLLLSPPGAEASFWVRVSNALGTVDSLGATVQATPRQGHDLYAMGSSLFGQLGIGISHSTPASSETFTDLAQVAAGYSHTLFLKKDGSLWTVGANSYGQLGDGSVVARTTPMQIATGVAQVAAGTYHSLFIKTDGSLWAMGSNYYGELGDESSTNHSAPIQVASDVRQVAAGEFFSLFIKTDGSLWAMGANGSGQLGDGSLTDRHLPVEIATGITQVAAGAGSGYFIKTDGTLWATGYNHRGQLGDGTVFQRDTPVQIAIDVAQVVAGAYHSLFVKTDHSLWSTGVNDHGQLGDDSSNDRHLPVQIATDVRQAAAGASHSLFLKNDGSLLAMGLNQSGQLGDGTHLSRRLPVQIATGVDQVVAAADRSLFIKEGGTLWTMGGNEHGERGDLFPYNRASPELVTSDVVQIAAGYDHSLFIKADGSLWGAGFNEYGHLGDGSRTTRPAPVRLALDVAQVAAGFRHSLFVTTDGTLWGIGVNHGSAGQEPLPFPITDKVVQVAAGETHDLFIKTDGTLWAMGSNHYGQLGNGSSDPSYQPVQVASGVVQVSAGNDYSLFLKTDGSLWKMGSLHNIVNLLPVRIAYDVAHVSAGPFHALFLKADGTLWRLGGAYSDPVYPVLIGSQVMGLAAGGGHSLLVETDGSLWSMGRNDSGQLGDGRYSPDGSQTRVAFGAVAVSAGDRHSLFLQAPTHLVTFEPGPLGSGGTRQQTVVHGGNAHAPEFYTSSSAWVFHGWDVPFDKITADLTVRAVYRRSQVITFATPVPPVFDPARDNTLPLPATASSGLPVILEVVSGPASVAGDGHTLLLADAGTVVLRATQPGDHTWAAALPVERRFIVKGSGKPQTIAFPQPAPRTYGDDAFRPEAVSSASLPVTLELVSGPAHLEDGVLGVYSPGRVVLKASQPGGNGFGAAPDVVRTLVVKKAPLTVAAENATRLIGEANPDFFLTYTGFVGGDALNEAAAIANLDRYPVARTKAGRQSRQGAYPITVSGGSDDLYEFIPASPGGVLTVRGFAGTYEALLMDGSVPVGKLTLTVPTTGFSYTGVLHLAHASRPIVVSSTSRARGTTPLVPEDIYSASATWTRAAPGLAPLSLALTVDADGSFWADLDLGAEPFGYGTGHRLRAAGTDTPWSGGHTLTLEPADFTHTMPRPAGFGHASVSMAPRTGVLTFVGRLADGSPLTASLKPDEDDTCHFWSNPYGNRTESYLAGLLADDFDFFVWKKAALPDSTPSAKRDKSHRSGFGPLWLPVSIDPWLPPVSKATASGPAVTLLQRLGLASENAASAEIAVSHYLGEGSGSLDLGASAPALPASVTLSAAGEIKVETPNTTAWKILALNPATGAFSGSFVLTDPTPTDANPDKSAKRSVPFSGTLRQRDANDPDDDLVGAGFFLLPALPGSESDEQISGELRFNVP